METEVLIIGGGVIGVCAAYYLQAAGHAVTLLEKGEIASGSSYGNAGLIVPSHAIPLAAPGVMRQGLKWLLDSASPLYIRPRLSADLIRWLWAFRGACTAQAVARALPVLQTLSAASSALYAALADSSALDFGYAQKGELYLYRTEKAFKTGIEEAHLLQQYGVEVQVVSPAEAQAIEPVVPPTLAGALFFPQDAHLIPDRFVRQMAALVEKRGVQIRTNCEALRIEPAGGRIARVVTAEATYAPQHVILAAGAWTPALAQQLGIRLLLQPAKGYSITVRRPAHAPGVPLHLAERRVVVTPLGDRLRFGGTLELAGLDLSISQRRVEAIRQAVPEYLPGLSGPFDTLEVWSGLRPLTPDTLPVIGRSPALSNLVLATGHGMLGMSLGPITGKLAAQLIAGQPPEIDIRSLSPARFG